VTLVRSQDAARGPEGRNAFPSGEGRRGHRSQPLALSTWAGTWFLSTRFVVSSRSPVAPPRLVDRTSAPANRSGPVRLVASWSCSNHSTRSEDWGGRGNGV